MALDLNKNFGGSMDLAKQKAQISTGSPDVLLVKLIYKKTEPNMYVKLQAKLTAKESK